MMRIHPILSIAPVIAKQRSGGDWVAYLEGLAHRAFANGGSEQTAIDNLARAVAADEDQVRMSAAILGIGSGVAA